MSAAAALFVLVRAGKGDTPQAVGRNLVRGPPIHSVAVTSQRRQLG